MNATKISLATAVALIGLGCTGAAMAQLAETATAGPYAMRLQLVWICAGVAAIVYSAMVVGLAAAKRPRGTGASAHVGSRRTELLWAIIPAVILIGLAFPAVDTLTSLAGETPGSPVIAKSLPGP